MRLNRVLVGMFVSVVTCSCIILVWGQAPRDLISATFGRARIETSNGTSDVYQTALQLVTVPGRFNATKLKPSHNGVGLPILVESRSYNAANVIGEHDCLGWGEYYYVISFPAAITDVLRAEGVFFSVWLSFFTVKLYELEFNQGHAWEVVIDWNSILDNVVLVTSRMLFQSPRGLHWFQKVWGTLKPDLTAYNLKVAITFGWIAQDLAPGRDYEVKVSATLDAEGSMVKFLRPPTEERNNALFSSSESSSTDQDWDYGED